MGHASACSPGAARTLPLRAISVSTTLMKSPLNMRPKLGLTPSFVRVYLTRNIDYSLDEENLQGLKLFYKLAHEAGITPANKEIRFA